MGTVAAELLGIRAMVNLGLITAAELIVVALAIWGATRWAEARHSRLPGGIKTGAATERGTVARRKSRDDLEP